MKTIVKGKYLKYDYSISNIFNLFLSTYDMNIYNWTGYYYLNDIEKINKNNEKIQSLKKSIDNLKNLNTKTYIDISKEIIDYETFYTSKDLEFQLQKDNLLHINEETYKIEKVEGTDQNQIIYYVDKELSIIDDVEKYKKIESQIKEKINSKINDIEKNIKDYEKDIQNIINEINEKNALKDEELKKTEKEIKSWIKRLTKKFKS